MKLFYTDAKRQRLQKIEIVLLILLLPLGLIGGGHAFKKWNNFKKAEALLYSAEAHQGEHAFEKSVADLEAAVKLCPEFYPAWESLAVKHHMRMNFLAANDVYIRAVEAIPEDGDLRRSLAISYHYIGKHDEEAREAAKAMELECRDRLFTQSIYERSLKEQSGEVPKERLVTDTVSFLRVLDIGVLGTHQHSH